jgi:membrane-bound lytic murein transglycosylase MltF
MSSPAISTIPWALALALCMSGCSDSAVPPAGLPPASPPAVVVSEPQTPAGKPDAPVTAPEDAVAAEEPLQPLATEVGLAESLRALIDQPFTGDLDGMEARRMIRVGVTFNRTHYFVDRGTQRGLSFAHLQQFETNLNAARRTGHLRIRVVYVPLSRDQLIPALTSGRVDAVAAQLTITPERQALVDFSNPVRRNVSEVVVTAPGVPPVKSAEDLSGQRVFVRASSSYADSLRTLNARLAREGRPPVTIEQAPEYLEDDDVLEMVNAGLVDITVVDDYLAEFWAQIFTDMAVHRSATLRTGGDLAIAFRKNSPKLAAEANAFIRTHGLGTLFGNTIANRYLRGTQLARRATTGADRERFLAQREIFRKYSDQYKLDYLMLMAKGYQESRLNQEVRSPVGAIGIMQIMPALGRSLDVGDIRLVEPNIHAGVKYTSQLIEQYLANEPMDELNRVLIAFASYNAGPTRIRQLRREAARRGLDPNVWFGNVERIAAERIGRETVTHVSNVAKYYIAFRLFEEDERRRSLHRSRTGAEP